MNRRSFLAGGLGAAGLALGGCAVIPVIPKRPSADPVAALGWIGHRDGRFTLILPRAEMGQNIATALKQIACDELDAAWDRVDVILQDTGRMELVRGTVGSDSVKDFALPLAQACAALRDAVREARAPGQPGVVERPAASLRWLGRGGLVGGSPPIEQGRAIVTGAPLFAADVRPDGVVHGRVLRAPASLDAATRPLRWNAAAARRVPGFIAIVDDVALRQGGSQGLGIVARTPGALDRIADALAVEWRTPERSAATIEQAIDIDARLARGEPGRAIVSDRITAGQSWDVDLRFDVPAAAHGAIEPRAAVARFDAGHLEVWAGSQDLFYVRDVLRRALGLGDGDLRVHGCRIGGGFGGRTICTVELEAAVLARAAGRPVKVQWTRAQEFAQAFHRPPVSHRVRVRLDGGRMSAWQDQFISSHILFTGAVVPPWMQDLTDTFIGDGGVARGAAPPYRTGQTRIAYDLVRLPVHTGPWRGLGAGPNALAIESAVDEAARAAGADPLAFRLAHIEDPRLAAVLRRVADSSNWGARPPRPAANGLRHGRGIACGIYKSMSYAAAVADVAVDADGHTRVLGFWCAHDCGRLINPDQVRAQCEGNLLWGLGMVLGDRLPVADGAVTAQTFADAPIPTLADAPPMIIDLIDSDLPPTGAGETAIVAAPGAIANAVRAATGVRPTRFPLEPARFRLA